MGIFSKNTSVCASPFLRRVLDLTTPTRLRSVENRNGHRYCRGLAVAICPWVWSKPNVDSMQMGITKDLSDHGICVLSMAPIEAKEIVFSLLVDSEITEEFWFFQATKVRESQSLQFHEYGFQVNEFLNDSGMKRLSRFDSVLRDTFRVDSSAE